MTTAIDRQRIRIQLDTSKKTPLNEITGDTPVIWRGNDVVLELAVYYRDQLLSVASLAAITAELKASVNAEALVSKTVSAGELNDTLTAAEWEAQTAQHVSIPLTAAETAQELGEGNTEKVFYLVFSALTIHSPARHITLGVANPIIREDGTGSEVPPAAAGNTFLNADQIDALYVPRLSPGSEWVYNGGIWYAWNPDQSKFFPLGVRGSAGQENLSIIGEGVTEL